MANRSRISIALADIVYELSKIHPSVYRYQEIAELFSLNRSRWNLPVAMNLRKFITAIIDHGLVEYGSLEFGDVEYIYFYTSEASMFQIVTRVGGAAHLSYATALYFWGLAEDLGGKVYLNQEQTKRTIKKGKLSQDAINQVFSRPQRETSLATIYNEYRIVLTSSKFSDGLGIIEGDFEETGSVNITDIERSLIDCVVRPAYAEPEILLAAFRNARLNNSISVVKLATYLKQLDYVYPYEQAIGLYLEYAGNYTDEEILLFKREVMNFDFYLDYDILETQYSEKWRLFFPVNFSNADLLAKK